MTTADNSPSNQLYRCVKCGRVVQALTPALVKRCGCGGAMKQVERK